MPTKIVLMTAALMGAMSSAASARDGLPYLAIEGGALKPEKFELDYQLRSLSVPNGVSLDHKTGFDVDLLAGYDFGFIRAEAEVGYKRASMNGATIDPAIRFNNTGALSTDGRTRVTSAMANLLLDFGSDDNLQVYGGAGIGAARVSLDTIITGPNVAPGRAINGDDRSFALQFIAGMRMPISYNVDLGLKYRYFRTKANYQDAANLTAIENLDGRFRSHSLLASLIFNLGSPPLEVVPPAPVIEPAPPPPPATQTCADGSVILATDSCPLPPPPPPPPPAPERG